MLEYAIEIVPDDNCTFLVTCPQIPMVATFGESPGDARCHAVDAIETALAALIDDGDTVPVPAMTGGETVRLPLLTALKVNLYWAFRASGLTLDELSARMDRERRLVERLFRIGYASRLDDLEHAFKVLGRDVEFEVGKAA